MIHWQELKLQRCRLWWRIRQKKSDDGKRKYRKEKSV